MLFRSKSYRLSPLPKGKAVKIPPPASNTVDLSSGNANDPADAGMCHWKSSLFFLTPALALELAYPERGPYARQSSPLYGLSVAHMTVSENAGEHTSL